MLTGAVLAGCSSGGGDTGGPAPVSTSAPTTSPATTPAATMAPPATAAAGPVPEGPTGDAFFVPPDPLPGTGPGDPIWTRPVEVSDGADGVLLLYRSEAVDGRAVAVSGVVITPAGEPPAGGRPVLVAAPGTVGLADRCATSRRVAEGGLGELATIASMLVAKGWVIAVTDYEGMGTPGEHPYVVGQAEGRNVLDLARAVARLPGTGVRASGPVLVWGHSQGGGAAVFAGGLQPTYAPELDVVGVAAGAPAAELATLIRSLSGGPYVGYLLMVAAGFQAAYPDLPIDRVLTDEARALLPVIRTRCGGEILDAVAGADAGRFLRADPTTEPDIARRLDENTPGELPSEVPVLLYHGTADEQIPVATSESLLVRLCRNGVPTERRVYPGADHAGAALVAAPAVIAWFGDRLAGRPPRSDCPA